MTRKDYILIAEAIRAALIDPETGIALPEREAHGVHVAAMRLVDALAQDNPRFDRSRFMTACNLSG